MKRSSALALACGLLLVAAFVDRTQAQSRRTVKPALHGRHWMAITGKPLAATAGALVFAKGGNAVDAACAMLAATCTMWDTLGWGGETQALVYDPRTKRVIGVNALGVGPTGATPAFYRARGLAYPPEFGPLAAVTPGTPGGLITMLAEYGRLGLKDVLAPAIEMADGYPIEAQLANGIERQKKAFAEWPYSRALFFPHAGASREAPAAGEIFRQPDLAATLRKLVEAEQQALAAGRDRKQALQAAYDRFYLGDIADELVRSTREQGGLFTKEDLARWQVKLEQPRRTSYRGVDVYKLDVWTQGPAMLQALDILENTDLRGMGYNSPRYVHTLYQAMNSPLPTATSTTAIPPSHRRSRLRACSPRTTRASASPRCARTATTPTCAPATRTRSRARRIPSARCSSAGTPCPASGPAHRSTTAAACSCR